MTTSLTFLEGFYGELLERGIHYFLPESTWELRGPSPDSGRKLSCHMESEGCLALEYLGVRYNLTSPNGAFTPAQVRMVNSIGTVLSARYELLFDSELAAANLHLFRGLPEDRYVSAYLDPDLFRSAGEMVRSSDRVSAAIEVLRISSSMTYENRRIETGALLFGSHPDPCHHPPPLPAGALAYSDQLTAIRSFHRLCDGLQTVALIDAEGRLVEIVDVQEWARPFEDYELSVPTGGRFEAHSRATLCGGHICLVLTPNGEIKVFAEGVEVFNFLNGRWRLTDPVEKYSAFAAALGDAKLAERLFTVALTLAEDRRGGLFVVLKDRSLAGQVVLGEDLLDAPPRPRPGAKERLHYLLRDRRVVEMPATVLETVARIDGAIVVDREANLLTFGAIIKAPSNAASVEGGRTTAAVNASYFGDVLKVSEDGLIAFFQEGRCVWEM